jgi:glycosyltransferase involved in cell wall biosynthesis
VRELGLGGRVHLWEERRDATLVLAGLDVAVSASSGGEGFSNVLIEAMASGVPCVVTDVGDSATIVADTGAVVPPRDPAALASGMIRLLDMPTQQREKLSHAARQRVVNHYSLGQVTACYQHLYEQLARWDCEPGPVVVAG